jgi:hypothetical protein
VAPVVVRPLARECTRSSGGHAGADIDARQVERLSLESRHIEPVSLVSGAVEDLRHAEEVGLVYLTRAFTIGTFKRFRFTTRGHASELASALMDGRMDVIKETCPNIDVGDLCDLFSDLCFEIRDPLWGRHDSGRAADSMRLGIMAATLAAAFMRLRMPVCSSELPEHHLRRDVRPPLFSAVLWCPLLAHALLDMPVERGLDLGWTNNNGMAAIGVTNGDNQISQELFTLLLARTPRSVVSAGLVYPEEGFQQYNRGTTHVLVSNILWCNTQNTKGREQALACIAHAQPDGDGMDLTAGSSATCHIPADDDTSCIVPLRASMVPLRAMRIFPDGKFHGALALVDTLYKWWSLPQIGCNLHPQLLSFATIRAKMITAMRKTRHYRIQLLPTLGATIASAAIHSHELHSLITTYLIVPLHDESQLLHPLLE